jgi:hypothetical protein
MPSKSTNSKASRSSSRRKANSLPKTKSMSESEHYLVVDSTLPSHVFSNRSLFTTYVPSRQLHQTVFGANIVIEGVGDVHVCVVVSGKSESILFRFRDSWHVPSSQHHFLSCSRKSNHGCRPFSSDNFFPPGTSCRRSSRPKFSKIHAIYTEK